MARIVSYSTASLRFMFTPVLVLLLEVTVGLQQSHHLGSYLHDSACCHEPRCRAYEGADTCVRAPYADHVHGHLFSTVGWTLLARALCHFCFIQLLGTFRLQHWKVVS